MTNNKKNNFVAYGILIGACLVVAAIRAAFPELFMNGPPSFDLFLSFPGTIVFGALGLVGLLFLNRSTLRGLWDDDLSVYQKLFIPFGVGVLFGLVNLVMRQFIPIDEVLASFAKTAGGHAISPSLVGSILGYGSGAILINIMYFLILIPPVVYLVSDRLLKGQRQALVFWAIAILLAFWEPLTNPPLSFSIGAFGVLGAVVVIAFGTVFTLLQAWYMRVFGFVALVSVRLGLYAITHVAYTHLIK